jgi:hypothetical protein
MYGLFSWMAMIANIFQYPLYLLMNKYYSGGRYQSLIYSNLIMLFLCIPLIWFCYHDLKIIIQSYSDSDIMRIQNKINNETTMMMTRTAGYESLDEITKDLEDGRGIGDVKGGTYNILHEIQKEEEDEEDEEEEEEEKEEEIRDLEGLEMIPHHEEDEMGK